jgi:predicted dehydrogenase
MRAAVVGTGYVADFYRKTWDAYPELELTGVWDNNPRNLDAFVKRWGARAYGDLDALLGDDAVDIVLNLTNPRNHFAVTSQCLNAGKHVYSEKPLGMSAREASILVELAETKSLYLASAPSSVLSETAQTLGRAIRDRAIGTVRLVYANFDDGMIAPRMSPWTWTNESGTPWPAKDEFEVGSTYEHAAYVLTWLAAYFGPALRITSFASCQLADKGIPVDAMAPDFSVGCIEYAGGVVARVTCGLVAPRDKSITVVGDDGVLFVGDVRNDAAPVMLRSATLDGWRGVAARRLRTVDRWLATRVQWPGSEALFQRQYPPMRAPRRQFVSVDKPVDFMSGPAEMVDAIRERRRCRLSARLGTHIVEIIEALQYPERFGFHKEMTTTFDPIEPLSWAT